MKVMFLIPYPLKHSPSQRFRFEQYFDIISNTGIQYTTLPFFSDFFWSILYHKNKGLLKAIGVACGFFNRFLFLFYSWKYDLVFLHREASPVGPPVFEWLLTKVLQKKIIYDFDDSIWHTDLDKSERIKIWLRNPSKTKNIIKWSWKVSCGNLYLVHFAQQYNQHVVLNPTTIDTEHLHNRIKNQNTPRIVIGWTGSHSTLKYLTPIVRVIEKLERDFDFDFLVICNQRPDWQLKSLKFIRWHANTEVEDLMNINIGLMPLPDDEWSKGKCGFKALQYMALGMPSLASPVGVNATIIEHEVNGFLCRSDEDWENYIRLLLANAELRTKIGLRARATVEEHYSVASNKNNFLSLFKG